MCRRTSLVVHVVVDFADQMGGAGVTPLVGPQAATTESRERREQAHHSEQAAHRGFHASGWTHFEQEAGFAVSSVAKDMELPTWDVRALARPERPVLAAHPERHCSREHLDPFVLSRVHVTRDPAPTIEPHLYLKK